MLTQRNQKSNQIYKYERLRERTLYLEMLKSLSLKFFVQFSLLWIQNGR